MEDFDSKAERTRATRQGWAKIGRACGYVAGAAFVVQTILFLLDATGILVAHLDYTVTTRGMQQDLADYSVALNERMHTIWWNVAIRDTLGPLGYLALMVLILAVAHVTGRDHPRAELAVLFTVVGAAAAAASDLLYLSHTTWWRGGGFQPTPDVIAYGRASELLDNVGTYLQWAGFLVLAAGFVCLGAIFRASPVGRPGLPALAYTQAGALLTYVTADIANVDIGRLLAALAAGVLIGPPLVVVTGRALDRAGMSSPR